MKKVLLILLCIISVMLVSCTSNSNEETNGTSKRAIEEGKVALVSQEYEKALDLFQLAINEDSNSSLGRDLLELTTDYMNFIDILKTNDFDKMNELESKIEANSEFEIIEYRYNEEKEKVQGARDIYLKYNDEISKVEQIFKDGKLDEAKTKAKEKLKKVSGYPIFEERLNKVITNVDDTIKSAMKKIQSYLDGYNPDEQELTYMNMGEGYRVIPEISGKRVLNFECHYRNDETTLCEYQYDLESGNIYKCNQGLYYFVNNNQLIYNANAVHQNNETRNLISSSSNGVKK